MNRFTLVAIILISLLIGIMYFIVSLRSNKGSLSLFPTSSSNMFSTPTPGINDVSSLRNSPDMVATPSSGSSKGGLDHERMVVVYSDTGFAPSVVTVSVGQTVTFINESKELLWVVSGPTKDLKVLPSFDQGTAVANGSFYEYTFTDKGQWSYLNHQHPEATGLIQVR